MLRSFELNITLPLYIDVLSFHILISKHINVINLEKIFLWGIYYGVL